VALGLSVSLIHKALDSDSAPDLTFGVLFALVFLLVRWASPHRQHALVWCHAARRQRRLLRDRPALEQTRAPTSRAARDGFDRRAR
jgi:hypothetical protein